MADHHERDRLLRLQDLMLARIYHEDTQLAQRTNSFLTVNAFLAGVLALSLHDGNATLVSKVVVLAGFLLSLMQAALGRANERHITFWRATLHRVEKELGIPLDSAVFNYFRGFQVTFTDSIQMSPPNHSTQRQPTANWQSLGSSNLLVGVAFPLLVALFWLVLFATQTDILTGVMIGIPAALVVIASWRRYNPPAIADNEGPGASNMLSTTQSEGRSQSIVEEDKVAARPGQPEENRHE